MHTIPRLPRRNKGLSMRNRIYVLSLKIVRKLRQPSTKRHLLKVMTLVLAILTISRLATTSLQSSEISSSTSAAGQTNKHTRANDADKTCAILFFGLIKDSFQTISFPSIKRNILNPNPQCDVYLHTYNLTSAPLNTRNAEISTKKLNVSEAYLLTNSNHDHVVLEGMDSFERKRGEMLQHSRKFYHRGWGDCCGSHDNMIKQWNSIERVWDLMEMQYSTETFDEDKKYGIRSHSKHKKSKHYDQVGLFRSDVYYTRPINLFDSQGAVPKFAMHHGYNDRLFYGSYHNAKIWASKRFEFVDIFEKNYMKPFNRTELDWWTKFKLFIGYKYKDGYHSESFVKKLLDHYGVKVELKDHCVWRVRTGEKILAADCDGMNGFSTFGEVKQYRPFNNESGVSWSMVVE